jgi:hypothetical protein
MLDTADRCGLWLGRAIYNRNVGANGNLYTGTYDSLGRMIFPSLSAKF